MVGVLVIGDPAEESAFVEQARRRRMSVGAKVSVLAIRLVNIQYHSLGLSSLPVDQGAIGEIRQCFLSVPMSLF